MSAELPELVDLIPAVQGEVVTFFGTPYWMPTHHAAWTKLTARERAADLVRIGVQVYEVFEWHDSYKGYRVRKFRCNLSEEDLAKLANAER